MNNEYFHLHVSSSWRRISKLFRIFGKEHTSSLDTNEEASVN